MLEAIILGIVQGLTEFLPISSSGHLVLGQELLGVLDHQSKDVVFEVVLHLGTLVAVLAALWRDVLRLLAALLPGKNEEKLPERKLILWILLSTIPTGLIGFLLRDTFEAAFQKPWLVSLMLLVTACILFLGDRLPRRERTAETVGPVRALWLGLAQALAILPGISRSGTTIVAGIAAGVKPEEAARYSFLISIPAVLGALVLALPDLSTGASALRYSGFELLAGFLAAALVGYMALQWLLVAVRKRNLSWFALYCAILGVTALIWSLS